MPVEALLAVVKLIAARNISVDGRKDGPINHGPTSEDTLLEVWNCNFVFLSFFLFCPFLLI